MVYCCMYVCIHFLLYPLCVKGEGREMHPVVALSHYIFLFCNICYLYRLLFSQSGNSLRFLPDVALQGKRGPGS